MALELSGYQFEGPFLTTSPVRNESGLFVVLGDNEDKNFKLIDVGQAEDLRHELDHSDHRSCWESIGLKRLAVAVHYTPDMDSSKRAEAEKTLRSDFQPPCGGS